MKVAILSSVYGGYDTPASPPLQTVVADWILVTDRPQHCWPWQVRVEPRPQLHPRLAAKVAKCRPDLYTDADYTIWVDGHLRVTDPGFVAWCLDSLNDQPIAQLPHPNRRSITQEAALSRALPKYEGLPVIEQVTHYLSAGYPDDWGLWATGLIVRVSGARMRAFGDAWLSEQVRWTYQDQLSEAPTLHAMGIRPADLDGTLTGHPMFRLTPHGDGTL